MEKLPRQTQANTTIFQNFNLKFSFHHTHHFLQTRFIHPSNKLVAAGEGEAEEKKQMASTSAVSMSVPLTHATQKRITIPSSNAFLKAAPKLPLRSLKALAASKSNGRFEVRASSMKEKVVSGLTAAALTASMIVPDVAEAATISPSLKNFLLSIAAGGVVAVAILGAVIGVSNFDPVKRN